jgi:S-adenosylmethionine:tRNA ribosyltransferase-isomerase
LLQPCDPALQPLDLLNDAGHVPLPPYIRDGKDDADDVERYQTVYADRAGSVAAPTAGLHFTPAILDRLSAKGVGVERVTLHVGVGTFLPIKVENVEDHRMHAEWCELDPQAAERLNSARRAGGRLIAVGTTATRTLESAVNDAGELAGYSGPTSLFVVPGNRFRAVDGLLTNFHLPKSTLLMLTTAFGGFDAVMNAYREAVRRKYRFFSYGDAMLILDL